MTRDDAEREAVAELWRARIDALARACRAEGSIEAVRDRELEPVRLAVVELWHRNLAWEFILDAGVPGRTLTGGQVAWMRRWLESDGSRFNGSGRQRGKSLFHLACVDWVNRQWPGSKGRWCGLTAETADGIVRQAYDDYFVTCPADLKPKWLNGDLQYPNSSALFVVGTDAESFRRARGMGRISVDVRDEYGFYQKPLETDNALDAGVSVPGPWGRMGRILYSTTPSESPAHESNVVAEAHLAAGKYEHETLFDNPRSNPESVISGIMEKTGLTREQVLVSTAFRREYMGERLVEETRAAVPRWSKSKGPNPAAHALVREMPVPDHVDFYVALDPGKTLDPHAALIAWWSFELQHLHFTHELEMPSALNTAPEVFEALKALEVSAFGANSWVGTLLGAKWYAEAFKDVPEFLQRSLSENAPRQPYLRVGDGEDATMLKDLARSGYAMFPTAKHDKHLAVDGFNDMVGRGQVTVEPRCVRLITQLGSTIWDEKRRTWVRTGKDHGDLIDDAVYISRSLNRHRDPRPKHIDSAQKAVLEVTKRAEQKGSGWGGAFK